MSILRILIFISFLIGTAQWNKAQDQVYQDSLLAKLKYSNDDQEKMQVHLQLAQYFYNFDYARALEHSLMGIELAKSKQEDMLLISFHHLAGNLNFQIGNYTAALENLHNSLSISNDNDYISGRFRAIANIGAIYDRLKNYEQAIDYYMQAIILINESEEKGEIYDKNTLVLIYNNIASAYNAMGKNKEAIEYYEKGIEIAKQSENEDGLAFVYNNLGKIKSELGNYEEAGRYLNKSIEFRKEQNDLNNLAKSYSFLALHFHNTNQADSAIWAVNECLKYAMEIGALVPQMDAYEILYKVYKKQDNFGKSLSAFEKHKTISDSILNEQKLNELSNLEINYKIVEFQKETEQQKQKLRSKYIIMILILGAITISAILLLFLARSQNKRVKLEKKNLEIEVELKNKELTTNVMYLLQKNELNNKIVGRLLELKKSMKSENQKEVQLIITDLQSEVDSKVWQEFECRFQQVHNDFYNSLRAEHPDLTPSEERLCALLRLNLTTKEIAAINHQSIRGIEVTRGRLRKKLNLTGTDTNLISYLQQF